MRAVNKNRISRALAALLALALLASLAGCKKASVPETLAVGADAGAARAQFPALEAETLEGSGVYTNDVFSGASLTAVCFWTADCPYCPEQMKTLEQLAAQHKNDGFAAMGLLLGAEGDEETLNEARIALSGGGGGILQLVAAADFDTALLGGDPRVPSIVFVDKQGRVASEVYAGQRDAGEVDEIVTRLLAAEKG